ncbi:unnamed protein product [Rotaria sordida]|uniref:TRPM SLOG domain-containing protein n=1 Tax=Rotaria sordida TaxID=392033 RepID=A0A814WGN9_9BILA|nr:unnamed protein product [Rotaria sordida]
MTKELSRAYNHVKEVIDKITNDTGEGSVTEIQRAIQRGLVEVAKITNAWVTTNGINHAMNCLVGEALRIDDIPCIGFCRWPWLQDPCPLQKTEIEPMQSIPRSDEAHAIEMGCSRALLVSNEQPPVYIHKNDQDNTNYNIEPNHTHFLLFDHNSSDLDAIIKWHHDIEDELSRELKLSVLNNDKRNGFDNHIPIVVLLFGGNFTTLRALCRYLKTGTPVVVVRV